MMMWLDWQCRETLGKIAVLALATSVLLAAAWIGSNEVYAQFFGPTHPESSARELPDSLVRWLWSGAVETDRFTVTGLLRETSPDLQLVVTDPDGVEVARSGSVVVDDVEVPVRFVVEGLKPATEYRYVLESRGVPDDVRSGTVTTFPDGAASLTLAFGSCARTNSDGAVFDAIRDVDPDLYVIMGDLHYRNIKQNDPSLFAAAYSQVHDSPGQSRLYRGVPIAYTWDDHDFGKNDGHGDWSGKSVTRRAFVEYRANASFGHQNDRGGQGVYTSFRYGPVEVFLLDTRWFARIEPSPVDPEKPTLLGKLQWRWLLDSLKASSAPFKLIACGMIWDDKQNGESDDWGTYTHERTALFDFLGGARISGVMLIGGDIHCSRLLRYKTEKQVGYPIHQMIVSPIHNSTIPSLNVEHPDLIEGAAVPHVWLRVEVDSTQQPATLHAEWVQMDGREMWDVSLTEEQLRGA